MNKNLFDNIGIDYNGIKSVTPKEADNAISKGAIILDIREPNEVKYKTLDISKAFFLPYSLFKEGYREIPSDNPIIVMDSSGMKSREISMILKQEGFNEIVYMAGGLREWELDKLPVKVNVDEKLSGSCFCQLKPQQKLKKHDKS